MNRWISLVSLFLFMASVYFAHLISEPPGHHWPWYAATAVFAIAPLICGPPKLRRAAVGCFVISAVLIVDDITTAKRIAKQHAVLNQQAQPTASHAVRPAPGPAPRAGGG